VAECPKYRVRLFLSVDLVGSTSFKAQSPTWVTQIRHFYTEFPKRLIGHYQAIINMPDGHKVYLDDYPKPWKTIGDEILFCCRINSMEHLATCITAFLQALDTYGKYLDGAGKHLDVKGSGWVAAFPSPNVTVKIARDLSSSDIEVDEIIESQADSDASEFDFLGKGIDSGFRVARFASADKFVVSAELGWLLCEASHLSAFVRPFTYHGREELKGVIKDHPYPIVSIDSERNPRRREIRARERALTGEQGAQPHLLADFLKCVMQDEGIELPIIPKIGDTLDENSLPKSYLDFIEEWPVANTEVEKRTETEKAAAGASSDPENKEVPAEVMQSLGELIRLIIEQQSEDPKGDDKK